MQDGFQDAIEHYDDKDTTLDKAVDGLQKNVSVYTSYNPSRTESYYGELSSQQKNPLLLE